MESCGWERWSCSTLKKAEKKEVKPRSGGGYMRVGDDSASVHQRVGWDPHQIWRGSYGELGVSD